MITVHCDYPKCKHTSDSYSAYSSPRGMTRITVSIRSARKEFDLCDKHTAQLGLSSSTGPPDIGEALLVTLAEFVEEAMEKIE